MAPRTRIEMYVNMASFVVVGPNLVLVEGSSNASSEPLYRLVFHSAARLSITSVSLAQSGVPLLISMSYQQAYIPSCWDKKHGGFACAF